MNQEENAASRLALLLKRYALWVLALTVLVTGLALSVGPRAPGGDDRYETTAVIVAQQLAIRPEGFPRFAEAVFSTGAVRERAVVLGNLPYGADDLIPERADLQPFENTVALAVVGRDKDPRIAADIANGVASAFTDELNKAGPGVGVFAVQDTARVPVETTGGGQLLTTSVLAVAIGLLLGVGLVALYSTVRRPILTAAEAANLVGTPLVATLALPRGGIDRGVLDDPPIGVAAVARGLFPHHAGMAALVPVRGSERACSELAVLTASVLGRRGAAYLVASGALPPDLGETALVLAPAIPEDVVAQSPVLVDHPSEFDLLKLTPAGSILFLVVAVGTPRAFVQQAIEQFLPGEIAGTVVVRRPRFEFGQQRRARGPETGSAEATMLERRRAELQEDLQELQTEIERAGTTLRSLVREGQDLRNRVDHELEAELDRRRSELVFEARRAVGPSGGRPPAAPARPTPGATPMTTPPPPTTTTPAASATTPGVPATPPVPPTPVRSAAERVAQQAPPRPQERSAAERVAEQAAARAPMDRQPPTGSPSTSPAPPPVPRPSADELTTERPVPTPPRPSAEPRRETEGPTASRSDSADPAPDGDPPTAETPTTPTDPSHWRR